MLKMLNLPEQVLNSMIDRRLMRQEAERLRLTVSDAEISRRVLTMRDSENRLLFMKDGAFVGEATYRRMLANANLTPAAFEADMREQMLLEKVNRWLTEATFVGDDEVETDFASRSVKAKIAYALLPAVTTDAGATEADAKALFDKNPAAYSQPERRRAKYLLVDRQRVASTLPVTDAEVQAEYNANLDSYRKDEEVKARHILYKIDSQKAGSEAEAKAKADAAFKKLKAGADFAALAKAESEDPASGPNGGDLGSFPRNAMVAEFSAAAFGAAVNDIVGPVKTVYGYHVIQVLEHTEPRVQPLFEVAPGLRKNLQQKKAGDETKRLAREPSSAAKLGKKPSDDELRRLDDQHHVQRNRRCGPERRVQRHRPEPARSPRPSSRSLSRRSRRSPSGGPRRAVVKLVDVKKPVCPSSRRSRTRSWPISSGRIQDEATIAFMKGKMAEGKSSDPRRTSVSRSRPPRRSARGGPDPNLGTAQGVSTCLAAKPGDVVARSRCPASPPARVIERRSWTAPPSTRSGTAFASSSVSRVQPPRPGSSPASGRR
jgi:parvulin-like peptidyl-prolyl isomerase